MDAKRIKTILNLRNALNTLEHADINLTSDILDILYKRSRTLNSYLDRGVDATIRDDMN